MRSNASTPNRFAFALLIVAGLFVFAPIGAAAAPTTWNVTCGSLDGFGRCTSNLNQTFENASDGDTVLVGPGTYYVQATTYAGADKFRIRKSITVKSTAGAASTILQGVPSSDYVLFVHAGAGPTSPDGATIDGFTLTNASGGVAVQDFQSVTGGVTNNVTLKNLTITGLTNLGGPNGSHGVDLETVTNSRVDRVTVANAYNNGIYVFGGFGNLITNNTVQNTVTQHAIALSNTTNDIVSGNTVTGSAHDGIIALGTTDSRFERNNISGHKVDGITLTNNGATTSTSNFVGLNSIVSNGWAGGTLVDGTGIWLNGGANGNYVFGNNMSGSPENGMALFAVSSNYLQANRVHGNYQGGILIWNYTALSGGVGAQPADNVVRNNYVYYNPNNAMVTLRDTVRTDIGFNFFSGGNFPGDPTNPTHITGSTTTGYSASPGGIGATPWMGPKGSLGNAGTNWPGTADATSIFGNAIVGMTNSIYLDTMVTNATVSRNRFFGAMNQYSNSPASVSWDNGSTMGGNFWSGFAASGNPSNGSTPYTNIFCPGPTGCSAYQDHFPFASESLGQIGPVTVSLPRAGSPVAAGSLKTIVWDSRGCAVVDIDLMSGSSVALPLVSNYPDVGYFAWNVQTGISAGSYQVRVTCKNSGNASLGIAGTSGSFSIYAQGLTLLSPNQYAQLVGGGTGNLMVSWARGAGVTGGVDVYLSTNGAETLAASGVTGDYVNLNTSNSYSNRVAVRIVSGSNQDSSDGYFSVRATTGSPTVTTAMPTNVLLGTRLKLEWTSYSLSKYVDVAVFNGTSYVNVAQDLPDFGNFEWLVDDGFAGSLRRVQVTYKQTPGGPSLGVSLSGTFNIVTGNDMFVSQSASPKPASSGKDIMYTVTVGNGGSGTTNNVTVSDTIPAGSTFIWASSGCTPGAGTVTCSLGSMAPTGVATVKIVVRPTGAGTATNTATVSQTETDSVTGNNTSSLGVTVNASPAAAQVLRYRLYSNVTKEHLFTTDLNEYNVLGGAGWSQEGTVGHVLNNPGSFNGVTATPYYRLYNTTTNWHHWTTDPNEYYTLIQFSNWNGEGVDGYILPSNTIGATQLYRLLYPFVAGLHHWTIDPNEYNTLITTYGWQGEGGSGFVIQ